MLPVTRPLDPRGPRFAAWITTAVLVVTIGNISLQAGETVTCTFNNEKDAKIIVKKETNPDGDSQSFSFTAVSARFVRYVGHGATLNAGGTSTWNSVSEISVFASPGPSAPEIAMASSTAGNA